MTIRNRLDRLEQVVRPKGDKEAHKMADFPPSPRTVEEWNKVVAWHMGKSDGSYIEPDMRQAWEEWNKRRSHHEATRNLVTDNPLRQ